jgi:hypothetical protein
MRAMAMRPVVAVRAAAFVLLLIALVAAVWITAYRTAGMLGDPVAVEGDPLITYDSTIGFVTPRSAVSKRSYSVFTDSRGARVSRKGLVSPAQADIITIGSSFGWGAGVENEETFPVRVARSLGATGSNFAMAGYSTVQSLQLLERNIDLSPRLVIYEFITDHLRRNVSACAPLPYRFCMDVSHVAWGADGRPAIEPPWSNGVRRLDLQIAAQTRGVDPITWFFHGLDVDYGRVLVQLSERRANDTRLQTAGFRFLLEQMARTTREAGAKLLVVYLPVDYKPPTSEFLQAVRAMKLPFIDLTPAYQQHNANPANPPAYIPGDGHPSVAGHQLIAEFVTSYIRRNDLLPVN